MAEKRTGRTGGSSGGKPKPTLERGMGKNDVTRAYLNSGGEPPKIKRTGRTGGSPGRALVPYQEKLPATTGSKSTAVAKSGTSSKALTSSSKKPSMVGRVASAASRIAGGATLAITPNNNLAADADKPRGDQGWSGPAPKPAASTSKSPAPTAKPEGTTRAKSKSPAPKSTPAGSSKPKAQQTKPQGKKAGGYSQATKDWAWAERERMLMQRDQARNRRGGK